MEVGYVCQICHLNIVKLCIDAMPVALAMVFLEKEELELDVSLKMHLNSPRSSVHIIFHCPREHMLLGCKENFPMCLYFYLVTWASESTTLSGIVICSHSYWLPELQIGLITFSLQNSTQIPKSS